MNLVPYITDPALLSSPDPLNDSPAFSSPAKPHTARIRRSLPLQGSSPRKQTFQLDVGDQLSPQKIRVTVEAENSERNGRRGSGGRNLPSPSPYHAPTVRQSVRTTTTTVPVKGLSDSEDDSFDSATEKPTRGRGRPRKSFGTPIPAKSRNRAVTPAAKPSPRRRRTLGHLVDGDDPEDWDFAIGAGVEVSRGKGRSRSRSVKGATRNKSTPATREISSPDKLAPSTTSKKGRGRRKTLTPEEIIIHEDEPNLTPNVGISDDVEGLNKEGVLAQRNMNLVQTQSVDFTNRLATAMVNDAPDILHEKFSPVKKTPANAGRSNLRVESTNARSSTRSLADVPAESTTLPVKFALQPVASIETEVFDGHENVLDDRNEIGEIEEFDTILESEGFSMISVDSVPSLREHLSSPLGPNPSGLTSVPTAAIRNAPCLQEENRTYHEDSFSIIAPDILEAATPRKRASNPLLRAVLSANIPGGEDSFSSIPPEILEAATPGKQRSNNTFLSIKFQDRKSNDDSFSSIPPAILEAATPAKHVQTELSKANADFKPKNEHEQKPVPQIATVCSLQLETGKRSLTSSGLLTPNETPSPTEMAVQQPVDSDLSGSKAVSEPEPSNLALLEGSPILNSQIRSSPPSAASRRFTHAAHSRQSKSLHTNHLETPSIVFSSPSLPPLIQPLPLDRSHISSNLEPNQLARKSLSPIVRAGRVLQDIAMTSSSRSRTQSLGSPFKSPAAQRNIFGTSADYYGISVVGGKPQNSPENSKGKGGDLFIGFSDDTRRELRKSMMIGEELARNQKCGAMVNPASLAQEEDPFHSGNQSMRSPSPEERKGYTLELPSHKSRTLTELVREELRYHDSPRSESAMSWQAESAVPLPTSPVDAGKTGRGNVIETTELFQQRREAEWARERAAVSSQIESASPSKVIIIESDGEEDLVDFRDEIDDAEEDIWQAEARHSSVLEEQSPKAPPKQEPLEKPQRSKIPSLWRKNSERFVYSDELSQLSSPQQPENVDKLPSDSWVNPRSKPAQITVRKRASPHEVAEDEEDLPDSSIMWHIPQKSNFAPRPRNSGNLDLSALLGSSPFKRPQPASQVHSNAGTPVFDTSRGNVLNSAEAELALPSSSMPLKVGSVDSNEESQSAENNLQDDNTEDSTNTSYEESELASEASETTCGVFYPNLPNITLPSPQKSCLRTPASTSPTKSVTFVSPTPSPPPLSGTEWSKAHWKLLHAMYGDSKPLPHSRSNVGLENGNRPKQGGDIDAMEPSKYLGKTIQARGVKLTLEQWHLDIVRDFREEVPGWDEGVIAKRLFAIIAGEDLRSQGNE